MVNQNDFCPGTRPYSNREASVGAVFIGMVCSASGTTIPLPLPPVGVGVGWSGFEYENAQESTR